MTVTLFATILTIGAMVNALLTEAIKKMYENDHKEYSANVVALADAIIVGGLGTAAVYMLLGIPWTVNNIICLLIMTVAVCAGAELRAQTAEELLSRADSIVDVAKNESDKEIAASLFNQAAYRYLSAEAYEKAITYAEKSLINARQCDRKDIIYDDNLLLARTNTKIDEAELALYYYIAANSA